MENYDFRKFLPIEKFNQKEIWKICTIVQPTKLPTLSNLSTFNVKNQNKDFKSSKSRFKDSSLKNSELCVD